MLFHRTFPNFGLIHEHLINMARRQKRKHTVDVALNAFELTKAGTALTIKIYEKGEKFGELQIGQGSIRWWSRKKQKPTKFRWQRFAELMDDVR